jgi:hypothetical protein
MPPQHFVDRQHGLCIKGSNNSAYLSDRKSLDIVYGYFRQL